MSFLDLYRQRLRDGGLIEDPEQTLAAEQLERVRSALLAAGPPPGRNWLSRLRAGRRPPIRGLYLWGDVGRGKTWLLDLFFHSLPFADKRRWHFHRFMHAVHEELARIKGTADPTERVAVSLMDGARVPLTQQLAHRGQLPQRQRVQ